jgi:hypothetical protein
MPGGFFPVMSMGDLNAVGGIVMTGVPNVLVGPAYRPMATMVLSFMSPHVFVPFPPKPVHPPNPIALNCTPTVLAGVGHMPVAHLGSIDMCLHPMIGPGTPNVLVGIL